MDDQGQPRIGGLGGFGDGFGAYLVLSALAAPLAPWLLRRRVARGKDMPDRWRERLGHPGLPRPDGPLMWLHAVGLGEALALRALIAALEQARPGLQILVTTGTRGAAEALAVNGIGQALHQFMPLDLPGARRRFLDHWRPDYVVWSEQDIWPGFVHALARRGVPQSWINARMDAQALERRRRGARLFAAVYRQFRLISAQDAETAAHIAALGRLARVDGSLKPAALPLADHPLARAELDRQFGVRRRWLVAASHAEDETVAFHAYVRRDARDLLIIAPRYPERGADIARAARGRGLVAALRSQGDIPQPATQVYIADRLGEMGLWYRLADVALIGGTFGPIEGHNPWEAAALGTAILHGPRSANFRADYAALDQAGGALPVQDADALARALDMGAQAQMTARATDLVAAGRSMVARLAGDLLADLDAARAARS